MNTNSINIKSNYDLSNYVMPIVNELNKLGKKEYCSIFEKVIEDVEKEEKAFIRNETICSSKKEQFKAKFLENYIKHNKLLKLFIATNNLNRVTRKKKGINYIGINSVVDKTYFLESTPNNRCIIWTNFEASYADSFIDAEEQKISYALNTKSTISTESIKVFFNKLTNNQLKKSIIFSDYETIHKVFSYNEITYDNGKENQIANMYIKYKKVLIPVIVIAGLEDNCIFHVYKNRLGKLEKNDKGFTIEINDFSSNPKLLNRAMKEKINGLDLEGEERENSLLESVELKIEEYIIYHDENLCSTKFNH